MTVAEMVEAGMAKNADDWWVTEPVRGMAQEAGGARARRAGGGELIPIPIPGGSGALYAAPVAVRVSV